MAKHQLLQIAALSIALVILAGLGYALLAPQNASASLCSDGRINCDAWQTGAVYCDASGVRVLYSREGDPRQGQTAVSVSAGQINATGVPSGSHALLADNGAGYTLHRLTDGHMQFTAPGLEAGSLYEFRFPFPGCRIAYVPPSVNNPAPTAPGAGSVPTPTLVPTLTIVPPIAVNINCIAGGQFSITLTGGSVATTISFALDTNPTSFPLVGTLNGPTDSASQTYTLGGTYNITGSYSIDGGPPQSANTNNCPG